MQVDSLPREISMHWMSFLSPQELMIMARTTNYFSSLVREENIWEVVYMRYYANIHPLADNTWRERVVTYASGKIVPFRVQRKSDVREEHIGFVLVHKTTLLRDLRLTMLYAENCLLDLQKQCAAEVYPLVTVEQVCTRPYPPQLSSSLTASLTHNNITANILRIHLQWSPHTCSLHSEKVGDKMLYWLMNDKWNDRMCLNEAMISIQLGSPEQEGNTLQSASLYSVLSSFNHRQWPVARRLWQRVAA